MEKSDIQPDKDKNTNFIIISVIVTIVIIGLWVLTYCLLKDLTDRGTFGDMFGSVNALFSGLALAGIILTILLQHKELKLQREELILTRKELMRSAKAQEESGKALTSQLKSMVIAANINGLSTIIDYYNGIAENTMEADRRNEAERRMGEAINDIAGYMDEINKELKNQIKIKNNDK